jgi:hypothetical protein
MQVRIYECSGRPESFSSLVSNQHSIFAALRYSNFLRGLENDGSEVRNFISSRKEFEQIFVMSISTFQLRWVWHQMKINADGNL